MKRSGRSGVHGCAGKGKPKRSAHKFHFKPTRSKGNRGLAVDAGNYDGAAVLAGKRGGLVRVGLGSSMAAH